MKRCVVALTTGLASMAFVVGGVADAQYGDAQPPTTSTTAPQSEVAPTSTVPDQTTTTEAPQVGGVVITQPPQNPGAQNPGVQNPGVQNPGAQNPGVQNPGVQNPAVGGAVQDRPQTQVLGVTQSRSRLPRTGEEAAPYAVAGAALVGVGAVFVAAARKRRGTGLPA